MLRARIGKSSDASLSLERQISDHELEVLLEELQIFQLELEMQNDELSNSYHMLELERAKFVDFFNLAPVGYFILDYIGLVEEANQTGADMLAMQKSKIIGKKFQNFIAEQDWQNFYGFLHQMNSAKNKLSCEIILDMSDNHQYDVRMEGIAVNNGITKNNKYYVTIIAQLHRPGARSGSI